MATTESTDLPWFKFNIGDYLRATRGWPAAARACYIELLAAQWDHGELPIDDAALRALVGTVTDDEWTASLPHIDRAFPVDGDARKHQAFARMRDKQLLARGSRSEVAKKAAAARYDKERASASSTASSTETPPEDA